MLRLAWREQALDDLDAIIDYIRQNNFRSAERMQDLFEACADRLTDHPICIAQGGFCGTREAVVHPNYILIYRVGSDAVEIVNVIHSRQQYPPEPTG